MKKKVGIVVQRYGKAVNGGAEVHARMIAEKLSLRYDVRILTSQALDYTTWLPHYPSGESVEDGINITRFENHPRGTKKEQAYWGRKIRGRHWPQKLYRLLGKPQWFLRRVPKAGVTPEDGIEWLKAQGPFMPSLPGYLKEHEKSFTAFIFITALYYPSAMGVMAVPRKAIFIPTMHDEKAIYGSIYQQVMAAPRWLLFNTRAEKDFSERLFSIGHVNKRIVGVGVECFQDFLPPDETVPLRFGIVKPYLIYVGRIDSAKGCDVLIDHFIRYQKETHCHLQLVMVGKRFTKTIPHPAVVFTDFADEETKRQLMLQAQALVIPSVYESLSLVLLESFGCKVPVIANGHTEVLKDHIDDSGGGWHYHNYEGFKRAVNELLGDEKGRAAKGAAGYHYVKENYSWEKVMAAFDEAITDVERANQD